jgi:Gram-negative bacterial TonB protein C-terminal
MWRWWGLAVLGFAGFAALAVPCGNAIVTPANPEDGNLVEGRYTNEYFKLVYSLPSGWSEDRQGPAPSYSGYYVLMALKGGGGRDGTMLISAQDQFFATDPPISAAQMVEQFRRRLSEIDGMTIDHEAEETTISGARFTRLDYSGVGLFRAMLVAESRCHFVSFNLTTNDPDVRASLAQSVNDLSMGDPADRPRPMPICVKDYATPERLLSRVNPTPAGPNYTSIPVRIIIGVDGRVRHIHVIRASAEQKESITAALSGWQFRPATIEGRAVEVETGVTFRF